MNEYLFANGEEEVISAFLPHAFKYIFNYNKTEASSLTYPLAIYLHYRAWIKDMMPSSTSNGVINLLTITRDYMITSSVVINEHGKWLLRSTHSIQHVAVPVISTVHIQLMGMNLNVQLGAKSGGDGSQRSYVESTSAWLDRWAQNSWSCDMHLQLRGKGKCSSRGDGVMVDATHKQSDKHV
jgi:hypothetical protein